MEYRIKIKGVDGELRDAQSADEIQPGETAIIEPIDPNAEPPVTIDDMDLLTRMAAFFGMQVADFVEGAAKAFGIPPCAVCQVTKKVLYAIKQVGILRSTFLLMKTFAARFGAVEASRIEAELEKAIHDRQPNTTEKTQTEG